MINISKLYCDQVTPGDWLRYGKKGSGEREGEVGSALILHLQHTH